jgi:hypothetical protein
MLPAVVGAAVQAGRPEAATAQTREDPSMRKFLLATAAAAIIALAAPLSVLAQTAGGGGGGGG